MNYENVKRIREKISCPQLGDNHYGEWGALKLNQRIAIKELLDFVDAQENYIKSLQAKIEEFGEANEKQIPKKPFIPWDSISGTYYCPNCDEGIIIDRKKYCADCGQALDWSDLE